jgi:TrmH family RNA methyltransferase
MTFKHITSRDNPIFKQLKRLADSARERSKENKTLLDGVHLIESYMQTFGEPLSLVIPDGKSSAEATALMQQLEHVSAVMLPTLMFTELTPVASSTGILAVIEIPQIAPPDKPQFALMLENIQDPGNLGSMLRTALGAGVDTVYCSKGCTDVWSPKALRGGQGAQFHLAVVESADLPQTMQDFPGNVFATTLDGDSLYTLDLTSPTAFVIGNEGAGLQAETVAAATRKVSIPTDVRLESLNAATAAAICMFERRRQTHKK